MRASGNKYHTDTGSEIDSCVVKGPSWYDNWFACELTASLSAVDTLLVTKAAAIV